MRILVIGSSGQLGRELRAVLDPQEIIPLTSADLDVGDQSSIRPCLDRYDFSLVVNLAAFNRVEDCQDQPERAFRVNSAGGMYVALEARRRNKPVVYVSSDYVFGGDRERSRPYQEDDWPAPLNIYGASKLAGEHLVRAEAPQGHLIVRTSGLFGAQTSKKGWTFPELILQKARAGEELRVVDDQVVSPTYARDLALVLIKLIKRGVRGTLHLTNQGCCSWFELARTTLALAGMDNPVLPQTSAEHQPRVKRPAFSVLQSSRLKQLGIAPLRPWHEGLQAYLAEKGNILG